MSRRSATAGTWPWPGITRIVLAATMGLLLGWVVRRAMAPSVPDPTETVSRVPARKSSVRSKRQREFGKQNGSENISKRSVTDPNASPASRDLLALATRLSSSSNEDFLALAKSAPGGLPMRKAILREWARRDPEGMLKRLLADRNLDPEFQRTWSTQAISTWIQEDQERAIQWLDALPGSDRSDQLRQEAVRTLGGDGEAGLALDLAIKWPTRNPTGPNKKFPEWVLENQETALEKLQGLPRLHLRGAYLKQAGTTLAEVDPEAAMAQGGSLSLDDRVWFLKGIVGVLAEDEPEKAISLLEASVTDPAVLAAAQPAIDLWVQKDPEKAIAWTESHLVGKARMTAVVKAMGMLDNEKATEVLHTMTPGPGKNLAAAKVFESLIDSSRGTDPERVEDWITHFPDSAARSYSLDQEAGNLAREQPELAVSLAESEDPSIARRGVIRNAAWHLAKEDPVSAAAWARSLPERNRKIAEDALAR